MAVDPDTTPPSVRFLRGAHTWIVERRRNLTFAIAIAACALWLATGLHRIGHGETAALRRFGRLDDTPLGAGLNVTLPRGIDRVSTQRTEEVRRLEVAGDSGEPLALLTGDENLIETSLIVQYKVVRLGRFLFGSEEPTQLLTQAARAALAEEVARRSVNELLTDGRAAVQLAVRQRTQSLLDRWQTGLSLVSVSIQRAAPPGEAAQAFLDVADAKSRAASAASKAESDRERGVALAHGEAATLERSVEAWATTRRESARGAAERFRALTAQAKRSPALTRTDLHLRAIQATLPKVKLVILAPGETPDLDFHLKSSPPERKPAEDPSQPPAETDDPNAVEPPPANGH